MGSEVQYTNKKLDQKDVRDWNWDIWIHHWSFRKGSAHI